MENVFLNVLSQLIQIPQGFVKIVPLFVKLALQPVFVAFAKATHFLMRMMNYAMMFVQMDTMEINKIMFVFNVIQLV